MSAPRRWVDDPEADESMQQLLRGNPGARSIDDVTRRRLRARVARVSALPVAAAGWIFVKSAAAALGAVGAVAAVATVTGVVSWPQTRTAPAPHPLVVAPAPLPVVAPAAPVVAPPDSQPEPVAPKPVAQPPLAAPSGSGAGSLSAESALLEQARREMRRDPALALGIAREHAERFARGQLSSERTLIQVEALHRLGRDVEARQLGRGLLSGASGDLYRERAQKLLGEATP